VAVKVGGCRKQNARTAAKQLSRYHSGESCVNTTRQQMAVGTDDKQMAVGPDSNLWNFLSGAFV